MISNQRANLRENDVYLRKDTSNDVKCKAKSSTTEKARLGYFAHADSRSPEPKKGRVWCVNDS